MPEDDTMFLVFEDRGSDSPIVERVWRCHSLRAGRFFSVASSHWEMVVTRLKGDITITLRGPVTRGYEMDCPVDGEWIGIRFRLGMFMPEIPVARLIDGNDVTLRGRTGRSFWLNGSSWEYPNFENAEVFAARLIAGGIIACDPAVDAVLRGGHRALSHRTVQRRFLQATGMTQTTFRQIERARYATRLLRLGVPILDTVYEAGFFDQAHLTHSLRRLIGQTPASILRQEQQLSFLYKTSLHEDRMILSAG